MIAIEIEHVQSIAGADFTMVQGLHKEAKAQLRTRHFTELDVWNAYTRKTTRESLE